MTATNEGVAKATNEFIYRQSVTPPGFSQFSVSSSSSKGYGQAQGYDTPFCHMDAPKMPIKATLLSPAIDLDDHHDETYQCTVSDSSCNSADQDAGLVYHVFKHAYV